MLDANKLTYQVLLGWFGDVLAEPEPDHGGVAFHVQRNGQRQTLVQRRLVTQEDLDGPLLSEYENLKKSLFDVRPVSPSERTIFNKLQPPIGNHEGFLYRVLTEGGHEQLVWCWGFQRRTQYGEARLCMSSECSMLFLHDDLADPNCPHCGQSFGTAIASNQSGRSNFSVGKVSVAAAAVLLAGGTLWVGSSLSNLSADTVPEELEVELAEFDAKAIATHEDDPSEGGQSGHEKTPISTSVAPDDRVDSGDPVKRTSEPPELLVAANDPVSAATLPDSGSVVAEQEVTLPVESLFPTASLPDLSESVGIPDGAAAEPDLEPTDREKVGVPAEVVSTDTSPSESAGDSSKSSDVLSDSVVAQVVPKDTLPEKSNAEILKKGELQNKAFEPEPTSDIFGSDSETKASDQPVAEPGVVKLDIPEPADLTTPGKRKDKHKADKVADEADVSVEKPKSEVAIAEPVPDETEQQESQKNAQESLTWHDDYLRAYSEASREQRYLLMLFHEFSVGDESDFSPDLIFAPSMRPMLEQFSRVELPLNAAMPTSPESDSTDIEDALPELLLNHRSFRHLGPRPGLAIVDLTDPESANHARVVSALPLPASGAFDSDQLTLVLNLPEGAISQRTLVFAVQSIVPDSSLARTKLSPSLTALAHRNARYQAIDQPIHESEKQARQEKIVEEFGPDVELQELLFASEAGMSIHDAAEGAVAEWTSSPDTLDLLTTPMTASGMDMFQSPESGRWYVTCFVIR